MDSNSDREMMPSVSGVRARANTTRSASGNASRYRSLCSTSSTPSISVTRLRTTVMRQSNGRNSPIKDSVIPPPPRMVTRDPSRLCPRGFDHSVARAYVPKPRMPARAKVSVISATGSA